MKRILSALRFSLVLLTTILFLLPSYSEAIRIATWNLLNYPGSTGITRDEYFRKVIDQLGLDALVVQEISSYSGVNEFLGNVMNYSKPGAYESAPFFNGPDTDNALFYRKAILSLYSRQQIPTSLRDISEYLLEIKEGAGKGVIFRIYSVHLKSGSSSSDKLKRAEEATILRNYLNGLPPNTPFIICGDMNLESSNEAAFEILTGNQADNDGRTKDPINKLGVWNDNSDFSKIHTQSTRATQFGGGASGGLDDRFDLILISYALESGTELTYMKDTYFSFGNDGQHFNKAINDGSNSLINSDTANALYYASDHLPVLIELNSPVEDRYDLRLSAYPGGNTIPPQGTYTYPQGSQIEITAVPILNFSFDKWTGDVPSGQEHFNPISILMNSDKSLWANFLRNIYAPLNIMGQKVSNRSLSQIEYINFLTWQENPNNENITKYRIYQVGGVNQVLLAELNSSTFRYFHRNVIKNRSYNYQIRAVSSDNREGDSASISIIGDTNLFESRGMIYGFDISFKAIIIRAIEQIRN